MTKCWSNNDMVDFFTLSWQLPRVCIG
jgi:hypothetical protein